MWVETSQLNLFHLAPTLDMPTFFFLGRKDHWVPPEVSVAYINALDAPSKRLVWFEESGHEPFADEPAKFNALMAELVRPALPAETGARLAHTMSTAPVDAFAGSSGKYG
jgi:pimeloyl-ACP methyl ester carboxylesterase